MDDALVALTLPARTAQVTCAEPGDFLVWMAAFDGPKRKWERRRSMSARRREADVERNCLSFSSGISGPDHEGHGLLTCLHNNSVRMVFWPGSRRAAVTFDGDGKP